MYLLIMAEIVEICASKGVFDRMQKFLTRRNCNFWERVRVGNTETEIKIGTIKREIASNCLFTIKNMQKTSCGSSSENLSDGVQKSI